MASLELGNIEARCLVSIPKLPAVLQIYALGPGEKVKSTPISVPGKRYTSIISNPYVWTVVGPLLSKGSCGLGWSTRHEPVSASRHSAPLVSMSLLCIK